MPTRFLLFSRRFGFVLIVIGLVSIFCPVAPAEDRSADFDDDGRVDPKDVYYLHQQWQQGELGADLNDDQFVSEEDLHSLQSQWHETKAIENPFAEGRAVGIHLVTEVEGQKFTSGEMEIEIADSTDEFKPTAAFSASPRLQTIPFTQVGPSPLSLGNQALDPSAFAPNPAILEAVVAALQGGEDGAEALHQSAILSSTATPGTFSDQIGTFWGWTVWLGWDASWSETYTPEGESYAMVVYFAPEGIYLALQRSEFVYSGVDVFAGVGVFLGAAAFPGEEYFTKTALGKNVTLSLSQGMKFVPTFSPSPKLSLSHSLSFYREEGTDAPQHAFQLGIGASINFDLLPFSLPVGVSLGTSPPCEKDPVNTCGIYSGFWPIVIWSQDGQVGGNPLGQIIDGLEKIQGLPGTDFLTLMAQYFAGTILPLFYHLYSPEPVTLEDDVPPADNASYFSEFLQDSNPSSSPNTSINHLIDEVGQWLQSGQTYGLADAIQNQIQHDGQMFQEYAKSIEMGTKMGLELGEKHGYDAAVAAGTREDDKIFVEGVEVIPCPVGEWCGIVVTATEIAELYPGHALAEFEGVWIRFDIDSVSYLDSPSSSFAWEKIENGEAVYWFKMASGYPVLNGPYVRKDYNPIESKYIELKRRKVVPSDRASLHASDKALTGLPVVVQCSALNENGIPASGTATVKLYDYRDYLIAGPVDAKNGQAEIQFKPKPSIPIIDSFHTTLIGYSEEDARTGYALSGRGFSIAADVLLGGTSVGDLSGWAWQIVSSKEILLLPPDDSQLFTSATDVQVVNPRGIASAVYVYQP